MENHGKGKTKVSIPFVLKQKVDSIVLAGECDLADGVARLRVCRWYVWLS